MDMVKTPDDLYRLTMQQWLELPRLGPKVAKKIMEQLEASKNPPLERFIFGLGIRQVGEGTAKDLAKHFKTWDAFMAANQADLLAINGVGETVANSILTWKQSAATQRWVKALIEEIGIQPQEVQTLTAGPRPLEGQTWVVTGTLAWGGRDEIKAKLEALGATVSGSVSKKTTGVLAGENAGSKLDKAKECGVKVWDETEFRAIYDQPVAATPAMKMGG
jgi:DNA ligase (NAD+)